MQSEHHDLDSLVEAALLRKDVELLTEKVDKLSRDVEDLVAAWKTANYVVVFVKWLAGIVVAGGVIWAFVKGFAK